MKKAASKKKSNLNRKSIESINAGANPKIVYHQTGRIIANPFLNSDSSYYDENKKK